MARQPTGQRAPGDGALGEDALASVGSRPFGVYVHVPYCASRCGYCDFNTYTGRPAAEREAFAGWAARELDVAVRVLGARPSSAPPAVSTVFFGGGTPTLLSPGTLVAVLDALRARFPLAEDVEIALEANPETVSAASLAELRAGGFERVSIGMQSGVAHVLRALDREAPAERAVAAAAEARAAGFTSVGLDLIYGMDGERDEDWARSLSMALSAAPDSVSAYPLVVEPGTRLAARVRRGEAAAPDEDALARRYRMADEAFGAAGLGWYEVCNWASTPAAWSRHNLGYWRSGDWWGVGPGAHSHVGGTRWWNVLHPTRWAARLAEGLSPAAGREVLGAEERRVEEVLLRLRLAEGFEVALLDAAGREAAAAQVRDGYLDGAAFAAGRVRLTLAGRLVADRVTRALV